MAVNPTDRLVKEVVSNVSDIRTDTAQAMNRILEEADRNDTFQALLWGFIVVYLYNRAGRWKLQILHTPNQEYIAEKCHDMVMSTLEPDWNILAKGIPVSGSAFDPPRIV